MANESTQAVALEAHVIGLVTSEECLDGLMEGDNVLVGLLGENCEEECHAE